MNTYDSRRQPKRMLKPLLFALTLALPAGGAMAASMDDIVKTRNDQNIDQQYGRDSVYAFSTDAKPLKPEQTGSRDIHFADSMKTYAAEAWHKTSGFATGLWDKTTGFFHSHADAGSSTSAQLEPEGYGRAGGFVGADRIAVLDSASSYQANATPTSYSLAGTPADVKTGTAAGAADGLGGPSSDSANVPMDTESQTR